ncbi:MAG: cysteine peptidase family C39 domain-containing protein [Bacteroidota bacterium]
MQKKKHILTIMSVALSGAVLFLLLLTGIFIHTPAAGKKIEAMLMNAEYLGPEGVVFQKHSNDCGLSALQMVFNHYEIPSTVEALEQTITLSPNGASMLVLKETAEKKGLHVRGWRLTVNDLLAKPFPAILFIKGNHFIVVDSVRHEELFLRDPALGRIKMPVEQLPKIWGGETLILTKE